MPARDVLDDVLVHHHLVGRAHQGVEPDIDFRLAGGGHFMVMLLHGDARLLHLQDHLGADVLLRIGRRHREVAFLVADLSAQVDAVLPHVPHAFLGIDVVIAAMARLVVPRMIKNEEFGFGPPVRGVADLGALEIFLRLLRDVARIALIGLARDRIDHIADQAERRHERERVQAGRGRVRHHQHVAVIDRFPSADGRTVQPGTILEQVFRQFVGRNREMLPRPDQIDELQVHDLHPVLFCKL